MLRKLILKILKPKFLFRYIVKSKALSVAGGHPAKVFKTRDIEHYNELKNQKLFF
jgi:hypothetical protein